MVPLYIAIISYIIIIMKEKPQKKLTTPKNATLNQKGKGKYQESEKKQKTLAKVAAAKERASQMFSAFPSSKMQLSIVSNYFTLCLVYPTMIGGHVFI